MNQEHHVAADVAQLQPLPLSKRTRVLLELLRTLAACAAVGVNCAVALRVFGLV
jgi:hypothetical protein